ncbi:MAG TPA: hypothetical protein V6C97_30030 [Oculatellaceae cyanobacterium]
MTPGKKAKLIFLVSLVLTIFINLFVEAGGTLASEAHEGERMTLAAAVQPQGDFEENTYFSRTMTPTAVEIAGITDIKPLLMRLKHEQVRAKSFAANESSAKTEKAEKADQIEKMLSLQRLVYLRSKINAYLETAHLELDSVLGEINSGLADLADRKAMIADQRARTLRRTSFVNLVSGGFTKIGGYTVALAPASAIPTNVLEVFDGVVQVGLSALTLRQQKAEERLGKARPEILDSFLNGNNLSTHFFPEDVWTFLNKVPPRSTEGKTRRQILISSWVKMGRLSEEGGSKFTKKLGNFGLASDFRLDDLDDTVAMTSDLKSIIATMDTSLMELAQVCRDSYKEDPEI